MNTESKLARLEVIEERAWMEDDLDRVMKCQRVRDVLKDDVGDVEDGGVPEWFSDWHEAHIRVYH